MASRWRHLLVGSQGGREGSQEATRPSACLGNTPALEAHRREVPGPSRQARTGRDGGCALSPFPFLRGVFSWAASFCIGRRCLRRATHTVRVRVSMCRWGPRAAVSGWARGRQQPRDFQRGGGSFKGERDLRPHGLAHPSPRTGTWRQGSVACLPLRTKTHFAPTPHAPHPVPRLRTQRGAAETPGPD